MITLTFNDLGKEEALIYASAMEMHGALFEIWNNMLPHFGDEDWGYGDIEIIRQRLHEEIQELSHLL